MSSSTEILVVGAGVLGLCTAAELLRRGHAVTVVDPGDENASAVAAGMIAPAFESLADWRASEGQVDRADLFRAARDRWIDFAATFDLPLHREGAEWRGLDAAIVEAQLRWLGFPADRSGRVVVTPADWRTDPIPTLKQLFSLPGLNRIAGRVKTLSQDGDRWAALLDDHTRITAAVAVMATGIDQSIELPQTVARLVAQVQPIKGQIAVTRAVLVDRVIRGAAGYVAPMAGGAVIGATMDADQTDLAPDLRRGDAMVRACLAQAGLSDIPPFTWRVGVRGSTADGLAIAGSAGPAGLFVALAPRRNGWLLGPLVASTVADRIEGRAGGLFAASLDPARLG